MGQVLEIRVFETEEQKNGLETGRGISVGNFSGYQYRLVMKG
jgi:hypothetical protein